MLSDCRIAATIPVQDVAAVRAFYEDQLGLKVVEDRPDGLAFECAEGTQLFVFPSSGASDGSFTQASWECDDLEAEMANLRSRGVTFETYDMPGFTSDANGIVDLDGERGAWFKDPAGNLLALGERRAL
jgi:catechol 2,3-dioxygenase-like lactoylglutathione lyase family enzyme